MAYFNGSQSYTFILEKYLFFTQDTKSFSYNAAYGKQSCKKLSIFAYLLSIEKKLMFPFYSLLWFFTYPSFSRSSLRPRINEIIHCMLILFILVSIFFRHGSFKNIPVMLWPRISLIRDFLIERQYNRSLVVLLNTFKSHPLPSQKS